MLFYFTNHFIIRLKTHIEGIYEKSNFNAPLLLDEIIELLEEDCKKLTSSKKMMPKRYWKHIFETKN